MTKLEELKAALAAADAAYGEACAEAHTARAATNAAWDAYQEELKKQQESADD